MTMSSTTKTLKKKKKSKTSNASTATTTTTHRWYHGHEARDPIARLFAALDSPTTAHNILLHPVADPATDEVPTTTTKASHEAPPETRLIVAVDCEMVGVLIPAESAQQQSTGDDAEDDEDQDDEKATEEKEKLKALGLPKTPAAPLMRPALARVSVVDYHGNVLLDTFAKPNEVIYDYKTKFSGVTESDLVDAPSVDEVQRKTAAILRDKYIVGQSLSNDLAVLDLPDFPTSRILDTATYYRRYHPRGLATGLKHLARMCLGLQIQQGEHDSVIDARVSMLLYRQLRRVWSSTYDPDLDVPPMGSTDHVAPLPPPYFPKLLREHFDMIRAIPTGERFKDPNVSNTQSNLSLMPFLPVKPSGPLLTPVAAPQPPLHYTPSMQPPAPFLQPTPIMKLHPVVRGKSNPSHRQVRMTFYPWMNSSLIRFEGWPAWEVPAGFEVPEEWFMTLPKVDTSKPGARKMKMREAVAKESGMDVDGSGDGDDDSEQDANKVEVKDEKKQKKRKRSEEEKDQKKQRKRKRTEEAEDSADATTTAAAKTDDDDSERKKKKKKNRKSQVL